MSQRALTEEAKDDRRRVFLRAALDEFFEKGFTAARMEDIAKRASVTKGTLYLYFTSKEEVFTELINHFAAPNLKHLESIALSSASFSDAMDQLAAFAPVLIAETDMPRLMKVLIGDSHNFPDIIHDYRTEILERLLAIISTALRRARASGEIACDDADLTARLIVAPVVFSGVWQAVFNKDNKHAVDLRALFGMHADNIRRALEPAKVP